MSHRGVQYEIQRLILATPKQCWRISEIPLWTLVPPLLSLTLYYKHII